ncbi:MAG: MtrB/PioB family outer membrane beta-barrel protein [Gammaproteobacteria bacterium]|nr:MtrB/PioB family outer membrane beta-barrel protein [Gammaproteobacteria bacterium]
MMNYCVKCLTIAVVLTGSNGAWANSIEDTHRFRLGAYDQDIDVTGSATRDPLPEIDINFDRVLGLEESSTTAFFSYQWRFGEKWSLLAFYSQMEATGKKVATEDFNYNGQEFTVGARLETDFGLDTYLFAANYSMIRDSRKEVGFGFGLHVFDIETTIAAEVGAKGGPGGGGLEGTRTTGEVTAPLPNLRAYGTYMITDQWEISVSGGWLSFDYADYAGDYLYLTAFTEYRFTKNFGMGVSYQIAEIDVTEENSKSKKKFDMDFYGPSIFLAYGF